MQQLEVQLQQSQSLANESQSAESQLRQQQADLKQQLLSVEEQMAAVKAQLSTTTVQLQEAQVVNKVRCCNDVCAIDLFCVFYRYNIQALCVSPCSSKHIIICIE